MCLRKIIGYLWDLKGKKIERLELEARHPYAKVADKIERERELRYPRGGKNIKKRV